MADRPTLLRPPPEDPNKAPIENALEVTELAVLGPNIFTNTRPPWHPPGARGIYGGAVIAMCLAAAQRTVAARPDFVVHSCHCYFLLAGSAELPILFHVELVRDGRSFATRTVQARQRGRCIFTMTVSFVREAAAGSSAGAGAEAEGGDGDGDGNGNGNGNGNPGGNAAAGGKRDGDGVSHASEMPRGEADGQPLQPPPDDYADEPEQLTQGPFQGTRIEMVNGDSDKPGEKKTRQWVRARGRIRGGMPAHLAALAYVSDSYFIGTITRIHKLWRFPFPADQFDQLPADLQAKIRTLHQWEGMGDDPREMVGRPTIGMMVSLDHTIYFHEPRKVRADEWMLSEMESPWAGDGRGVVMQKIFSKDGTLLATCVQEGLVRLQEPKPASRELKL
ncbi:ae3be18e-8153-42fc-ab5c-bcd657f27521 [Thermothielavioides terrestris]|uniref:Ae3be18e-8153-42fc-ab5c-bcd657f27521 n=1 Tax=Thermothielavioides terrestris TaxID=2587410 RepID=A0A446B9K0_9PEZI|nr:ae3be18e-8153-42fc-ab5c-bcd657f27521 [Thermothielavioides terrestris]